MRTIGAVWGDGVERRNEVSSINTWRLFAPLLYTVGGQLALASFGRGGMTVASVSWEV